MNYELVISFIFRVTGYSTVEFKNGSAALPRETSQNSAGFSRNISNASEEGRMPKNKSYSEIIRNMLAKDDDHNLSHRYSSLYRLGHALPPIPVSFILYL